ncbi:hypothetical protein RvY_14071 [Ramazzottius varieornatus]|uniref:Thioredoxin domain-containing protein n=1 Tax=Ramazzottius varieornatus TaxID=947166 RepID=A0A1D1VYK4_RAMVA|nr:hypothetical protein RvY_14071 [Ramazzottius varieornatus]
MDWMILSLTVLIQASFLLGQRDHLHKLEDFVEGSRDLLHRSPRNESLIKSADDEDATFFVPDDVVQLTRHNLNSSLNETLQYQGWILKLAKGAKEQEADDGGHHFMEWARSFFPRKNLGLSSVDRFLKIVGLRSYQTCPLSAFAENQTDLDFSAGWEQRTILYLYRSNKTSVSCMPYEHSGEPQLTVIDGSTLQSQLANTTETKTCTVVFFFSPSCPYSRRAAPFMQAAAVYFPILRFVAVNTDKSPGVAGHYGIMGVPVVVLFHEKKFITGWTIPYPDARDTIRAFIMAYTDVKYIPERLNLTDLDSGIVSHFRLRKHSDALYMIAYCIVLGSFILYFWKSYLLDLIKRSVEQNGLRDRPVQIAPLPPGHDVVMGAAL